MGTSTLIEGLLPPAFDDPRSCEAKKRGRGVEMSRETPTLIEPERQCHEKFRPAIYVS